MTPKPRVVGGLYPAPHSVSFDFQATSRGAEWIDAYATEALTVSREHMAPMAVVHRDWRPDNLRVSPDGTALVAIYDWDSLVRAVDCVGLGEVAAMHSVAWTGPSDPYFANGLECMDFAARVERARSTEFTTEEWRAVRAAIVYGWCYTARCEHARAAIGEDRLQFMMRERPRADADALLEAR